MKSNQRLNQLSLFDMKSKNIFGGSLLRRSNPKEKRPISTKHPMHIVVRSSQVRGGRSFLTDSNKKAIDRILKAQAKRWGIRLYRYENVGNHLHIMLKTGHRNWLTGYLRSITGLIARQVLGVERGTPKSIKFWDQRPFSRIVTWGRAHRGLHRYFDKNRKQAMGFDRNNLNRELALATTNSS